MRRLHLWLTSASLSLGMLLGGARATVGQHPDGGSGWSLSGMGQAFPFFSRGGGDFREGPLGGSKLYLTQPVGMLNLASPNARLVLRITPNLEAWTIEEGEVSPGGWGEGYIDARHPHTVLHEAMLSLNAWSLGAGEGSLSMGKGFAPFGSPDPMSRPGLKYPTNHHLSQILERWLVAAAYRWGGWSLEASVFGGTEPSDPYDFSNIESFGDSWSVRVTRGFEGSGLEISGSFASVLEPPEPTFEFPGLLPGGDVHPRVRATLWNATLQQVVGTDLGDLYWLVEGSTSRHTGSEALFAVLAEARLALGPNRPYVRAEYAARPEFARYGGPDTDDFFRYGFEDEAIGATRWLLLTAGFGRKLTDGVVSLRPFGEVQFFRVAEDWGGFDPEELYGSSTGFVLSLGFRLFFGGEPMRMGSYGVLDPMTFGTLGSAH